MIAFRRTLFISLFLTLFHIQAFPQHNEMQLLEAATAAALFETISQNNAYVEDFRSVLRNVLPSGFRRVHNNMEITIAVDRAVDYAHYVKLSAFARARLPQRNEDGSETTLFFGARDIRLSHDGSIIGDARLVLLEDIAIPFNNGNMSLILLGHYDMRTGLTHSATYMSISCFGFSELSIDAKVSFPETLIERVTPNMGTGNRTVYGRFRTIIQDWNDIVAGISLPPFQIVGLDGFVFSLEDVIFDFSDSRNGIGFNPSPRYVNNFMIPGAEALWRGVFARRIEITLPRAFDDINGQPVSFTAENMLIDENGITGLFSANNILPFDRGNASGWNFSVNTFLMELEANRLIQAGFAGQIGLPFYGGNARLYYDARILQNNEYIMNVRPAEHLDFSIFNATATILPNSLVRLHVVDNQFRPEAILHGHMTIAGDGETPVNIPRLEFRSLHLKTHAPYISIGSLGYSGTVTLGASSGFGMSLSNIALRSTGNGRVELQSDVGITLIQGMFAGNTTLALLASLHDSGGRRQWRYDGTRIDDVGINASIANAIILNGRVGWHQNDPLYGDGFRGELGVTINPLGNLRVNMRGHFGAVDGFRYWFVDGYTASAVNIPIMYPALTINGFAGGVSQRMIGMGALGGGTHYVPERSMGLGLRASVLLGFGAVGNGEASFSIAFNDRGGLCFIGFHGLARFAAQPLPGAIGTIRERYNNILRQGRDFEGGVAALDRLKRLRPNDAANIFMPMPAGEVGILGNIAIQHNFTNNTFHAKTELFVNTPGNFFSGVGQRGRAGWGEFFIAPNEWFLHLGTPSDRLGVRFGLGSFNIQAGAYLMAGSRIPAMPPPPQQVANILGRDLTSLTIGRDIGALSTGRGFAFGSDFSVATGDMTFLILYANFMAGLGFDIMFKDFGNRICVQTGRPIGMNGWYAMGQAYAFLQGELGVAVNLRFIRTRIPIIRGGAATLMQAGLPNPAFFRGHLGVQFSVLGGLVRGNMRFKVSLGDECTPMLPGGSPLQMAMISDIAPVTGGNDISVFTTPQATFNASVGEQFQSEGNTYRIQLRSFTLRADGGQPITGALEWNRDRNAVSFQSHEILPPYTRITARVEVGFDRFSGGRWEAVISAGQPAVESKEVVFTTGGAPDYIPLQNITHAYPVIEQRYFLPNESQRGFIQLRMGQQYLLERGFDYRLVFTGDDGRSVSTSFTYNAQARRFDFTIPELRNRRRYTLQIVFTPDDAGGGAAGAGAQARQVIADSDDGSVVVESRAAYAGVNLDMETSILEYGFGTSRFATFRQKIESMDVRDGGIAQDAGVSFRFLTNIWADEAFDEAEVVGVMHSGGQPLIRVHAELREPFFTQTVYPLVYSGYPFGNVRLTHRNDAVMGVPPIRSVFIYRPYLNLIADGRRAPQPFRFPFSFETAIVVEHDFRNLQNLVANSHTVPADVRQRFLRYSRLPFIQYGRYRIVMEYVLPDGTVTSSMPFYFYNFMRFNP